MRNQHSRKPKSEEGSRIGEVDSTSIGIIGESLQQLIENPREFNGERVITLAEMDQIHEKAKGTSARAFRRARKNFPDLIVQGMHFFISPMKLRPDKLSPRENTGIGGNEDTILLTQRGYLMISKSLTGRRSWEVQDTLVRAYFAGQDLVKRIIDLEGRNVLLEQKVLATLNRIDRENKALLELVAPTRGRPSPKTIRAHVTFVEFNYRGRCPICQSNKVVENNRKVGDLASMGGRSLRETWLICSPCRRAYQSCDLLRGEAEVYFQAYQTRLRKNRLESLFFEEEKKSKKC